MHQGLSSIAPISGITAVTPDDNNGIPLTRSLYIGVAGDVKVTTQRGDVVTLTAAANGYHPVQVSKVFSTGTTATNILALY